MIWRSGKNTWLSIKLVHPNKINTPTKRRGKTILLAYDNDVSEFVQSIVCMSLLATAGFCYLHGIADVLSIHDVLISQIVSFFNDMENKPNMSADASLRAQDSNIDDFVKSLQFALLVTFDPALGGIKFASLNCKNSPASAGSNPAKAGQFWVPRAKRSLPVLH